MPPDNAPIRRILIALDASVSSMKALETAIELASRFGADITGLFVEDINLLRLAQLPFAREISFFSAEPRRIQTFEMELQLRVQAERVRRVLAAGASEKGVAWKFRIARGSVAAEILSAGADADLLVMGKIGRSLPGFQRTGSTVRMLLTQRRGMTMILQTHVTFTLPIVVLYDGSEAAIKALETATRLVGPHNSRLVVLILGKDPDDAAQHEKEVFRHVGAQGIKADFRVLIDPPAAGLVRLIQMEGTGPVVLPCRKDFLDGEQLCALVDDITNPVLLVR